MFDLFKRKPPERPTDVKGIREGLLQFIKEQLSKIEGGEGGHIKGLQLFIVCSDAEKHLYEAAVYQEEADKFKNEVQKLADDFAIALPYDWTLEILFKENEPPEAVKAQWVDAALFVKTTRQTIQKTATAYINVLTGTAEKETYTLESQGGKVYIGRDTKVQTSNGFYRINNIAFPGDSNDEANKFISRQHAHIEWDNEIGAFLLYADEGGLPPRNKVKVRSVEGDAVKLQTDKVGHLLKEGDQIMLGNGALLGFTYQKEK
jgi:pSer/pThr/pTyr-binding forkhead associated (FHA) protein